MANVIVQHLDPTHKGIIVELLQRTTPMPVFQVRDRQKVAPDRVYVIPPNKDMSIMPYRTLENRIDEVVHFFEHHRGQDVGGATAADPLRNEKRVE